MSAIGYPGATFKPHGHLWHMHTDVNSQQSPPGEFESAPKQTTSPDMRAAVELQQLVPPLHPESKVAARRKRICVLAVSVEPSRVKAFAVHPRKFSPFWRLMIGSGVIPPLTKRKQPAV